MSDTTDLNERIAESMKRSMQRWAERATGCFHPIQHEVNGVRTCTVCDEEFRDEA